MAKFNSNDLGRNIKKGAGYSVIILALIAGARDYINGKHAEEMEKIKYQYEIFQKDSSRRNSQEAWVNNRLDCKEESKCK